MVVKCGTIVVTMYLLAVRNGGQDFSSIAIVTIYPLYSNIIIDSHSTQYSLSINSETHDSRITTRPNKSGTHSKEKDLFSKDLIVQKDSKDLPRTHFERVRTGLKANEFKIILT
jgi:hypothetical protein